MGARQTAERCLATGLLMHSRLAPPGSAAVASDVHLAEEVAA